MRYCFKCGTELAKDERKCSNCGKRIPDKIKTNLKCDNCNTLIREDFSFCSNCGLEFEEEKYTVLDDINETVNDIVGFVKNRPLIALMTLFIIVASLYVKIDFAQNFRAPQPGQDDEGYHRFGVQIANGRGFPGYYYEPGFSYYLGVIYYLFGENYVTGRISLVFLSLINSLLIYKIAKLLFNDRVAWFSFIISLVDLDLFFFATNLYTEMPFIFFLLIGFYFLFVFQRYRNILPWIIACISLGLSIYMKTQAVLIVFTAIAWLFINFENRKRILRLSAVMVAIVIIVQAPWIVRNYGVSGGEFVFVSTNGGMNLWIGNNPYSTGCYEHSPPEGIYYNPFENLDSTQPSYSAERHKLGIKLSVDYIRSNPNIFIKKVNTFLTKFWFIPTRTCLLRWHPEGYLAYAWVLEILTIVGVSMTYKKHWKTHSLIYLFFLTTTVTYMISFYMQRYKVPLIPFAIIFASYAIVQLLGRLKVDKKHLDYWNNK